ncbi:uncharacterized protein LOC106701929 [Latimeria chalumnae]|uniref:uncharacterized protein LOC106701929 n=1 Tax=Latimeria chalumnae TaxID=7897 RepID=UPI00313C7A45
MRVIGRIVRASLAAGVLLSLVKGEGAATWGSECERVASSIPDSVQPTLGADATFSSDLKKYSAVEVFKEVKGKYKHIATCMKLTVISVGPQYEGRFTVENGGLILKEVQLSDLGRYCLKFLHEDIFAWEMQLNAPYTDPQLNISRDGGRISGKCESRGGYPEGRMVWHLKNGSELNHSANTTAQANSEGLFDIISVVKFSISQDSEICCTVSSAALMQNKTACSLIRAKVVEQGCLMYGLRKVFIWPAKRTHTPMRTLPLQPLPPPGLLRMIFVSRCLLSPPIPMSLIRTTTNRKKRNL